MPIATYTQSTDPTTVTSMQLRRQTGELLNRVLYRNERFIINRSGRPMAVLVSTQEYQEIERLRQSAREELMGMTKEMRNKFSDVGSVEVTQLVDKATKAARSKTSVKST